MDQGKKKKLGRNDKCIIFIDRTRSELLEGSNKSNEVGLSYLKDKLSKNKNNYIHVRQLLLLIFCQCSRYGLRGRELVNSVGKVMLQGGGTFGTFMAIGTGIRC